MYVRDGRAQNTENVFTPQSHPPFIIFVWHWLTFSATATFALQPIGFDVFLGLATERGINPRALKPKLQKFLDSQVCL